MRLRSGDYPGGLMALQIRVRRMVRFLRYHDLTVAARELGSVSLGAATGVFFDAAYMEHMMNVGSWDKADCYLQHFLTPPNQSQQSMSLIIHIRSAWTLAEVAAGGPTAADFASTFDGLTGPVFSSFRRVLHKMHADQPRAKMLWKEVAPSAVDKAMDIIFKCPELKGKMHLPRDRPKPWEVIPLFGARRASSIRHTKVANRTPTDVIVRALKRQKRSISTLETDAYSGFPSNASSSSVPLNAKIEQNAPKPIALEEQQKENRGVSPSPDSREQNVRTLKQSHD